MKKLLVVFITVTAVTLVIAHLQAQGRGGRGGSITTNGGIGYINPGSPTVPDAEINKLPIPRLPDGKIDLTGPWVGGGMRSARRTA